MIRPHPISKRTDTLITYTALFRSSRQGQEFGILARVDIVGDRRDVVIVAKIFAERVHQRRLSRSDRAANANAQWRDSVAHVLNSLVYWVSCAMQARSA